jgi:hypothetical protein
MRNDIAVGREPAAFHLEVIAAKDFVFGDDDLRFDGFRLRTAGGQRQAHE